MIILKTNRITRTMPAALRPIFQVRIANKFRQSKNSEDVVKHFIVSTSYPQLTAYPTLWDMESADLAMGGRDFVQVQIHA